MSFESNETALDVGAFGGSCWGEVDIGVESSTAWRGVLQRLCVCVDVPRELH